VDLASRDPSSLCADVRDIPRPAQVGWPNQIIYVLGIGHSGRTTASAGDETYRISDVWRVGNRALSIDAGAVFQGCPIGTAGDAMAIGLGVVRVLETHEHKWELRSLDFEESGVVQEFLCTECRAVWFQ
jgi:hypothetical protein